jgi:hypothetical protein
LLAAEKQKENKLGVADFYKKVTPTGFQPAGTNRDTT